MNISQAAIQFTAQNEGFVNHEYADVDGMSIGFGHHLLPGESFPNGITRDEAMDLLGKDYASVDDSMARMQAEGLIPQSCTQNQWDALGDFAFNLGAGSLRTMLGHGWDDIPNQILKWCHANGAQSPGLLARREKELAMYQTP